MWFGRLLILFLISLFSTSESSDSEIVFQDNEDDETFVWPAKISSPSTSGDANAECECVPYSRCKEVVEDGVGVINIRINNPCNSLEVCCGAGNTTTESIIPKSRWTEKRRCGVRNKEGFGLRITGIEDIETHFGEFPWMVALFRTRTNKKTTEKTETYHCGASLIHPQVVLTAAHCVSDKAYKYRIRAGEWDIHTTNELFPHQDREIKETIIHPQYYKGGFFYDFALLVLDSPLEISENVDVVCLPDKTMIPEQVFCHAIGWGQEVFSEDRKNPAILKKIDLPIVDRDTCQKRLSNTRLGSHFKLHETFICAGGELGKGACKGDGGSPLVCPIDDETDRFYQAGIVAWGIDCGKEDVPGAYADVAKAMDWIDEVMAGHTFDRSVYRYEK